MCPLLGVAVSMRGATGRVENVSGMVKSASPCVPVMGPQVSPAVLNHLAVSRKPVVLSRENMAATLDLVLPALPQETPTTPLLMDVPLTFRAPAEDRKSVV